MVKYYDFISLYSLFINDSSKGKRLKKNGTRITPGTIENYGYTLNLLKKFVAEHNFELRIPEQKGNNKREFNSSKKYWQKFYKKFTDYLYKDLNHYDNYVGLTIKNLRVFFNWLRTEKGINCGEFHKSFYVRKEEVPIITLSKEQLQFLIYDKSFDASLSDPLRRSKDFFVFGCIVGLRYSDLVRLTKQNLQVRDGEVYLTTKSLKTAHKSSIKLPAYLIEIIKKCRKRKTLLPVISLFRFNINIKKICRLAGWDYPVEKIRDKKGRSFLIKSQKINSFAFCDLVSSHTMRRTAITNMLTLGMPELLVRKISGHTDDSRAFYRYVELAQQYMDQEINKAYDKLFDQAETV